MIGMPSREQGITDKVLGYVVDNATPTIVRFVAINPPPLGDYVVIEDRGNNILALVKNVGSRSITLSSLSGVYDPVVVEKLSRNIGTEGNSDVFFECSARLLGNIEDLKMPRIPPLPGSRVRRASSTLLRRIFGGKPPHHIRIGQLLARPEVEVYIDVNKLVTRHTAILAVTGYGKSNTVAVIADSIARIGGTMLIFDFHGEYVSSSIGNGVNVVDPRINPRLLSISELMTLLGVEKRFYNQEYVLRKALEKLYTRQLHKNFFEDLSEELAGILRTSRRREEATAAMAVLNKIESLLDRYRDIIDDTAPDPTTRILAGKVNVVDLSRVDEDAADVVVSHILRVVLHERKMHKSGRESRIRVPILIVLEEAHILAPRDNETLSKYWLSRIAREGRKFGVGLMLVSQRPKNIDPNILSQANNLIVLRIIEPSDQRHIQEASENLSDDLVEQLPSLNTGEAVIVGPFIKIPALVKIDKFPGRLGGSDPDVVGEWLAYKEDMAEPEEETSLYTDFL